MSISGEIGAGMSSETLEHRAIVTIIGCRSSIFPESGRGWKNHDDCRAGLETGAGAFVRAIPEDNTMVEVVDYVNT